MQLILIGITVLFKNLSICGINIQQLLKFFSFFFLIWGDEGLETSDLSLPIITHALLGFLFDPEDGASMFLQNVAKHLPDYVLCLHEVVIFRMLVQFMETIFQASN
jgi:hypothetical protein